MKKLATILLVAMLAVACIGVLAACDNEPLAHEGYEYTITGAWNGWGLNFDEEDATKLDAQYTMEPIAVSDKRVKSIKSELKDVKYLYIIENTFVNEGAGWTIEYALAEGDEVQTWDGNMAIKVLRAKFNEAASDWTNDWLPDAGGTTFKSLTPSTLYMPPHTEGESWAGSGTWNDNPIVLEAGTYYVVFAAFNDGTFGLGAIAK